MEPILPIVHMNGTSKQQLIDNLYAASGAVYECRERLAAAAPNGRDYYLVPGLADKAFAQHARRMKVLDELFAELQAEAIGVSEQGND